MENISIQIAALANERVKEGKYAEKPQAIIMCDDPLAELATIDNLYTSRRPRIIDINGNIVSITEKDRKNIDKKQPDRLQYRIIHTNRRFVKMC